MKYIIIIIGCLLFVSCSSNIATSEDLLHINSKLNLSEAKEVFEGQYEHNSIIKKNVGNDDYTVLIIKRITSVEKKSYSTYDSYQGRQVSRSRDVSNFTNFYLVFKNDEHFFAGYGYETEISTKRELLNSIINRTMERTE